MYAKSSVLLLTVIVSVLGGASAAPVSPMGEPVKIPEGYMLVREDSWAALEDQLTQFFHLARQRFFENDSKAAASEVRKGIAFLRIESDRATPEGKTVLMASVDDLQLLANGLENGTVSSASALDYAFARANYALANHHQLKAEEAWARERPAETGAFLSSAAKYLSRGTAWAGSEFKSGTDTLLPKIKDLGGRLRDGTGWAAAEVGRGMQGLGGEIRNFGNWLTGRR